MYFEEILLWFLSERVYILFIQHKEKSLQVKKSVVKKSNLVIFLVINTTGTRIPGPHFSSFGPSRDYGMDLCLEVYL